MKKPSKASFAAALAKARELKKPVVCGWHIFMSFKNSAETSWPKNGRADKKSTRWFRQNYREAWIVSPDGSAYDVFDAAASTISIDGSVPSTNHL